jgi:ElaB/YqjD/DUF883 family membrane-anchored ribosome-binding protein
MADTLRNNVYGMDTALPVSSASLRTAADGVAADPLRAMTKDLQKENLLDGPRELVDGSALRDTAQQIGVALGSVVVRTQTLRDNARRQLHVVRERAQHAGEDAAGQVSQRASSLAETAMARGEALCAAAEQRAAHLLERARELADDLGERAGARAGEWGREIDQRTLAMRQNARMRAMELRRRGEDLIEERPMEVLGGIAVAAFATGVALRVVRANHACRQ